MSEDKPQEERPLIDKPVLPLATAVLDSNGEVSKLHVDVIIEEEIPILCVNWGTKKERLMPFKVLYDTNNKFWEQDGSWEYFFTQDALDKFKKKVEARTTTYKIEVPKTETAEEVVELEVGFGDEYKVFSDMPLAEKIDCLNNNKERLSGLLVNKPKEEDIITEAIVDTTKDVALINHTALEDAMRLGDDEAKELTKELVASTHEMVKMSVHLISQEIINSDLMKTLVEKSNGTIVQHMTRVYLNGISFMTYYNKLVSSSSAIQKIRIAFPEKYRKLYHSLLPHVHADDIIPERVFYGGMRAISPELLNNWAVGFLIHDIGKAAAVEYHEGEAKYDRNKVIEHVKLGYHSVLNKTNYPLEASLIIGYHHEYYGNPDGYGYFRAYLQQYKKQNPEAKQDYCITFEKEPILDYHALAYFPAKVLEIIDVYDSVTDPNRVYRKAMTPEEALAMMREQFIETHLKIDPILFDIFELYINEQQKVKNTHHS